MSHSPPGCASPICDVWLRRWQNHRYGLTVVFASPRENHDSRDRGPATEVDHPDRLLDVEIVEHRAGVESCGWAGVSVDGT